MSELDFDWSDGGLGRHGVYVLHSGAPALSFLIENRSNRSISLVVARYEMRLPKGHVSIAWCYTRTIGPDGTSTFSPGQKRDIIPKFQQTGPVRGWIDLVVFDDGSFAGLDVSGGTVRFQAEIDALRDVVDELEDLVSRGVSFTDIRILMTEKSERKISPVPVPAILMDREYGYWSGVKNLAEVLIRVPEIVGYSEAARSLRSLLDKYPVQLRRLPD